LDDNTPIPMTAPGAPEGDEGAAHARLVLVRHGETDWSLSGQHTGVTDLPLTEHGEEEARDIAEVLHGHPFGLVLSSPRQRAIRTAELAGYGDRVEIDPNLAEWDYGAYEGMTTPDILRQRGGSWNLWLDGVPAGATPGEDAAAVRMRARDVIERALPTLWSGQDVVLFSHGHMLRAIGAAWLNLRPVDGAAFSLATATLSVLAFEHARAVVKRWNCPPGVVRFE
jgi:probable phosphoglycerate mutase